MSALVPEVLRDYGGRVRELMPQYLAPREPRAHLYDLVADYPRRGGRALRPSLCIATARALGAPLEEALCSALSIELFHNALLIHDDIEDQSELRRGQPTLHLKEGLPLALNAGDMLLLLSLRPLRDNRERLGLRLALRIFEETERMSVESAEGQALELGWRRDNVTGLGVADYLTMVLKKTSWLGMIHPSRVGAIIGSSDGIDLDPFVRFGALLGAAFQIQDDLLNLLGDATAYGKELGGDIHEGKRTLMLIHLLQEARPEEQARITRMLGQPREQRDAPTVAWVRERMDHYGSLDYARAIAHGLAGAARHEFERIYGRLPDSRDKRFIGELPVWVIERN